jgi:putative hydrolase of the HAD superfamily
MKVRAVVFDLDDTLIDTSGQLLLPAHQEAAAAMVAAGLQATVEQVAQKRLDFAAAAPGPEVDLRVAHFFDCVDPEAAARAGHQAFYGRRVRSLDAIQGVHELLEELGRQRSLFLVTAGFEATQRKKVELTGLERHFEQVTVLDVLSQTKDAAFGAILEGEGLAPQEVVAVGDRIDAEIAAARRLGLWAVRVLHGEGARLTPAGPEQRPHYSVPSVLALPLVLEDIEADGGG